MFGPQQQFGLEDNKQKSCFISNTVFMIICDIVCYVVLDTTIPYPVRWEQTFYAIFNVGIGIFHRTCSWATLIRSTVAFHGNDVSHWRDISQVVKVAGIISNLGYPIGTKRKVWSDVFVIYQVRFVYDNYAIYHRTKNRVSKRQEIDVDQVKENLTLANIEASLASTINKKGLGRSKQVKG